MGDVWHRTRRTVTSAFARKDTQGYIVKRVRHNLVCIYKTASNLRCNSLPLRENDSKLICLPLSCRHRTFPNSPANKLPCKLISFFLQILTSAVLPSGPVTSMQTARTLMAPTHVPIKVDFMEMEKRVWVDPICS